MLRMMRCADILFKFNSRERAYKIICNQPLKPCRTEYVRSFMKKSRSANETLLKQRDGISTDSILIYNSPYQKFFLFTYYSSTVVLIGGLSYLYWTWDKFRAVEYPKRNFKNVVVNSESQILTCLISFTCINIILRFLSLRCPLRVYFCPKSQKYVLILLDQLPMRRKTLEASQKFIKRVTPSIVPFSKTQYVINGKNYYLFDNFFRTSADLGRFCGVN
ncbi:uncharacterized protein LOC111674305 [Orussus abietinus]|uniref:uncharacterized protein LOC111674305 n=1 Tax=Orussus abietinus TaxID=222816 RepID=UPI000C715AD5|nr:uncharacterized protein LOC111674305 [Orussus abietinus]